MPRSGGRRSSSSGATARDTLAFFKLRRDKQYLFGAGRQRVPRLPDRERRAARLGRPRRAARGAARTRFARRSRFAERARAEGRGARRRASELVPLWRQAGLRALYIGDEAIVETAPLLARRPGDPQGAPVGSAAREGRLPAELRRVGELDEGTLDELEAVSARWRAGASERGFSMAMDSLRERTRTPAASSLLARDGEGRIRGFLHLVPSYGRPAMSLSFDAPRPRHAERADGVPRRSRDRARCASAASRSFRSTSPPSRV